MKSDFKFVEGMAYVPIPEGSKSPTKKGWNLRDNCVVTTEAASRILTGNVGLAHAYSNPITCALDIDHMPSARKWFDTRGIDLYSFLGGTGAAIAFSGRDSSVKAFYSVPALTGALTSLSVEVNGKVSFELRCASANGKTVCDVIPPSKHPSGTEYQWVSGDLSKLAPLPLSILEIWEELLSAKQPVGYAKHHTSLDTPRRVAILRELLRYINPDCDYHTWRDVVFSVLSTGYTDAEEIALEWSAQSSKFDHRSFRSQVNSYQDGFFSLGTVYHYATLGGYHA
jgi:hypothetical protein